MRTNEFTNPIWERVQEIIGDELEGYGLEDRSELNSIKADCTALTERIQDYIESIKEDAQYSDDPYIYNGVSRSDFL